MRAILAGGIAILGAVVAVTACGFGIDVDGVFAGASSSSGGPVDGSVVGEASIPTVQVLQLAAGDTFTCGRRADGTVMCWGTNDEGQLGNADEIAASTPSLVKDVADATDLSVGAGHACIVRKSGAVSCWGRNDNRQLGDGTTDGSRTPRSVISLTDAVQVAAGGAFSCAVRKDGSVVCWGANDAGQLGDGTTTGRSQPAPVAGVTDAVEIATGRSTACARVKSGDVYCWGDNTVGTAGADSPDNVMNAIKVAGLSGVKALAGSGTAGHVCALLESGAVSCWGYGGSGNLGNGKGTDKNPTPSNVVGLDDAVAVDVGGAFTCAVRKSGAISCWGDNGWRKLGLGDDSVPDNTSTPVPVAGIASATLVATGDSHTCALLGDGNHISCWGANADGALGRGTRVLSESPVKVVGPAMTALGVGTSRACGVDGQGNVLCWGGNDSLQLGSDKIEATGTPEAVPNVTGATRVSGGNSRACAVVSGGQVSCWGDQGSGALGNGKTYSATLAVTFPAGGPATDTACGYAYCCALLASGQVVCSGSGDQIGSPGGSTSSPVPVSDPAGGVDGGAPGPLANVTRLVGGGGHACAIHAGKLACWGSSGYDARGPNASGTIPNDLPLDGPPIDVSGDGDHGCAVLQGGGVRCWGRNNFGQTTGSDPSSDIKSIDLGGKTAKAIASGYMHTCAIVDDDTVRCWGRGREGQIGNGVRADSLAPVAVKDLANVKAIAAYDSETCAIQNDGTAWCWGSNGVGQLGDGTVVVTGTPGSVVGY